MLSLLKNLDKYSVILASSSPRRFELLKMIGLDFKVRPSHVEEIYQDHQTPLDYTKENARNKGEEIAKKYRDHIVISADTIVVLNNQIIQKPENEKNAREISVIQEPKIKVFIKAIINGEKRFGLWTFISLFLGILILPFSRIFT